MCARVGHFTSFCSAVRPSMVSIGSILSSEKYVLEKGDRLNLIQSYYFFPPRMRAVPSLQFCLHVLVSAHFVFSFAAFAASATFFIDYCRAGSAGLANETRHTKKWCKSFNRNRSGTSGECNNSNSNHFTAPPFFCLRHRFFPHPLRPIFFFFLLLLVFLLEPTSLSRSLRPPSCWRNRTPASGIEASRRNDVREHEQRTKR